MIFIRSFGLAPCGMRSSVDPNDWWMSSKADLRAMDVCYNEKLYGVSAYHCQQALEKAIKSAAFSHNLKIDPKMLGHDILLGLFKKTVKGLSSGKKKGSVTKDQNIYFQRIINLLKSASGPVQIDNDNKTTNYTMFAKNYIWGNSLGIKTKNKKFEKFVVETLEPAIAAMNDAKWIRITDVWKIGPNMKSADLDRLVNLLYRIIGQQSKIKKPELRIFTWTLPHISTILNITPHEEYGRYPGSLCGITRKDLYSCKRKALRKLEFDVRNVIEDLDKNVRRNAPNNRTR